ncbi:hypothetical protein [Micromonospora ureilytica]|uniref:hypothetical protein n=1 Tax=Micromonospora ureilytica TaxID=709868 RepID=UPI002E10347A|nr:hypothetical protein OHB55_02955 [Micromonospora ureilytica]
MEHQIDGLVVDGDHEVATLLGRWEMIKNGALSRRQSIELMKEVVWPHGPDRRALAHIQP